MGPTEFTWWIVAGKLGLAVLLGGAIGWQRELMDRPAGLRTHILVCVGSCAYMLVSMSFAGQKIEGIGPVVNSDPGRIAAQVASGMGFLGAGTILRHGTGVRGLTTAASLWTVAGIGLCVGRGRETFWVALMATAIVFVTLTMLRKVEGWLFAKPTYERILLRLPSPRGRVAEVQAALEEIGAQVQSLHFSPPPLPGLDEPQELHLELRVPPGLPLDEITARLARLEGLQSLTWE